ncbi:multiprotein-bridging factor 1 family protein, partial [Trueperella sp.]|uniref:helix-turn-helix domain-containing protein n=1 Tax=Trueperella sp. TaxID=2699835 RepID=UPI0037356CB2
MRVGERVVERRTALGMNQRDLARAADVTATTVRSLEQDRRWPQDVNRAKIEQALGWAPGSLEAIRDGGEPTTVVDD